MKLLILGDCIEKMADISDRSIDLIIADPPFGIKHDKELPNYNRDSGLVLGNYIEVPEAEYDKFSDEWISQAARVLSSSGTMYIISGWNRLEDVLRAIRQSKLNVVNHIIWHYPFGVYTKKKYVTSHYHILMVTKKKSGWVFNREAYFKDSDKDKGGSLNYTHRQDVWTVNRENWSGKIKTQNKLPRLLVKKMILYSSNPRHIVLDPFMGSGQVPWCAESLNRSFIGIEMSEPVYEFAKYRIEQRDYFATNYKGGK